MLYSINENYFFCKPSKKAFFHLLETPKKHYFPLKLKTLPTLSNQFYEKVRKHISNTKKYKEMKSMAIIEAAINSKIKFFIL
jgi:hypothetical protein